MSEANVSYIRPADETAVYSLEAEQAVLGTLLLAPEGLGRVVHAGAAELFADPVHADIYRAIAEKDRHAHLVSPVTVSDTMRAHEGLEQLGGPGYLVRLAGSAPASASLSGYIDMLADLRRKREISAAVASAQAAIAEGREGADRIAATLEAALIASEPAGSTGPVSMLKAVTGAMDQIKAAYTGDDAGAVRTGIGRVDEILGALYQGDLIYLGGRPSMGKTSLALSIALNVARSGRGVAIASLEMTPEAMAMRALSEQTSHLGTAVYYTSMRRGGLHDPEVEATKSAARTVSELPISFLPRQYNDIGALSAGVKQVARTSDLGLVIVDYLQLMRSTLSRGNANEHVSDISKSLKALSMQVNVPVIALSQLSRAVEQRDDKRPQLSDLRDSGSIEQDADAVLFCYRDEYYLEREEPGIQHADAHEAWQTSMERARNRLEIIVAKQRQGAIGTARVRCNPALNIVWED